MSDNKSELKEVEIIDTPIVEKVEQNIDLSELTPEEKGMAEKSGIAAKEAVGKKRSCRRES